MRGRLIIAIVSTVLEEAALAVIVLWALPQFFDINIPLWTLIIVMVGWAAFTITTYRMGSRALKKRPVDGLTVMVGSRGEVVNPLNPAGMVRIRGELWRARSAGDGIATGEEVVVVGQDGLELLVCVWDNEDTTAK